MLEEKGDMQLGASYSQPEFAGYSYSLELDYAITPKFNFHALGQSLFVGSHDYGSIIEIGMGYYRKFNSGYFLQTGVNYGYMWGSTTIFKPQYLDFSNHVPTITTSFGIKGKILFFSGGVKAGFLIRDKVFRNDHSDSLSLNWYDLDDNVLAYEKMKAAYFAQGTLTFGFRYQKFSMALYYSALSGPVTIPDKHLLHALRASIGLKLQFTPNIFTGF
ncbi:MAG: hypothetical protein ACYC1Q_00935 [Bacteroidia bacterium]